MIELDNMSQEFTIKIFNYPLSEEDTKKDVEKLLDESFGISSGADPQRVLNSKDTHYSNPVEYILVFNKTELVGIQMLFLRKVIFENQNILIGGLGGLCVKKEFREKGIAKQLLAIAMSEMQKLSCDVSILFTNIKNPRYLKLYGAYGFKVLNREYSFMSKSGKICTGKSAMIAPINSSKKYDLIVNSNKILNIGAGEW